MNKILIAFVAGVAAGFLLAPAKGSQTRTKLTNGLDRMAGGLTELKDKYFPSEDQRVWQQAFGEKRLSSHV